MVPVKGNSIQEHGWNIEEPAQNLVLSDYDSQGASGAWWAGAVIRANYTGLGGPGKYMGLYSKCSGKPQKGFKQESDLLGFKDIILVNE